MISYICTPYRAKDKKQFEKQLAYTKSVARAEILCGNDVIVPHLYYTQLLDDDNPEERKIGMNSAISLLEKCDKVVVGNRYGISAGMEKEIYHAMAKGIEIQYLE
jgi:hypothetical protein